MNTELMDKIKENLPKIKEFLFGVQEPIKMGESKLVDGVTIVKWEGELKQGTPLVVVSEEGMIPAPDGEHELVDGQLISTMGGLVTEIKTKEQAPEEENPTEQVGEIEMSEIKLSIEELKNEFSSLKSEIESFKSENATLKTELAAYKEQFKLMFEVVETISEQPSVEGLKPENVQTIEKTDIFSQVQEVAKFLNQNIK
jgi:FtsZ-binding cell division protein ZapB